MAEFSGAVRLGDFNDFIAPSQSCVVSLDGAKKAKLSVQLEDDGLVQMQTAPRGFQQTSVVGETQAVKVTLHDCLACSGCVTSAETVLLEHQSTHEFEARLADASVAVIVSLSPQSRASLAAYHGLEPAVAFRKLTHFLKGLGVRVVLDTSCSRDMALMEAAQEFIAAYQASHSDAQPNQGQGGVMAQGVDLTGRDGRNGAQEEGSTSDRQLPILASACPGWVCYAEKTHGDAILPYISTAKSPQALMGSVVKRFLASKLGLDPEKIYHCAVMPCYDKKLEASRDDFYLPGTQIPEVDSVLTSVEVQQLLESRGLRLQDIPESPLDTMMTNVTPEGDLYGVPGGSGGYLEHIFRRAANALFGEVIPEGPLVLRSLRNPDFREITLQVAGRPALRFAAVYGFRNIQTLVRQLKRGGCPYHYVEVMACPSGCLNGGGQLKAHAGQSTSELLAELEVLYDEKVQHRAPELNPTTQALYTEWVRGGPYSGPARQLAHTQYHARKKSFTASVGDW